MTPNPTSTSRFVMLAVGGLALVAAGASGMYVYLRQTEPGVQSQAQPVVTPVAPASGEITITLTPEAVTRAGIRTARPTLGQLASTVTVPGIGQVRGDVAWGGNWFFIVRDHGQELTAANVGRLTEVSLRIRAAVWERAATSCGARSAVRATRSHRSPPPG